MFIKHPLTKIPKEIKKETFVITILGVITSIGFDFLAFFLQLGKDQVAAGNIVLGLILIGVYYTKSTLDSSISLWMDDIQTTYREHYTMTINNNIVKILLVVRGKVWRINEKNNSREKMSTNTLLRSSKEYLSLLWNFKTGLPKTIFQVISVICMFIGFVMVTTIEIEHTFLFISIIIVVSILSVFCSLKRTNCKNKFRKSRKDSFEKQDMALNDVLNIEPVNTKHAKYMADNYISHSKEIFKYDKKDRKDINKINFFESLFDSIATISIIGIKVYETGLENVDLTVVLSIIALVSIYSQIMNRVDSIIRLVEDSRQILENLKIYKSDFSEILQVLDEEEKVSDTEESFGTLENVTIPKFTVQYQAMFSETPFSLNNETPIKLTPGDIVLLTGPTGSGKSTFMKMVTRSIKFKDFELFYKRKKNGQIHSVMHQTDGRLGSNSILSELVFDEQVDTEKLLYILKGLHLYEEISEKNDNVLEYLTNSKIEDYSTGQKQRMAIARLLYNLDESVQIIGFDEATNALNDAITLQTLNFIKEFCADKILVIATHQVDIGETIATKEFKFVPSGIHYSIVQKK